MTDTQQQGVMAMVKIDGGKVKQLREQKGLTQLYVATVVQVTTDTISRWENKRYPTIKKDNGLRLAEALEVDLDDILETDWAADDLSAPEMDSSKTVSEAVAAISEKKFGSKVPMLIVLAIIMVIASALGLFFFRQSSPVEITAKRTLPKQCTAGQPFPVTIEVTGSAPTALAIIVKEQFPDTMKIRGTEPSLPSPGTKNNTLKWLQKIEGRAFFTYIATISQPFSKDQALSGTVATSNNDGTPVTVTGMSSLQVSTYHWADSDGDNIISDKEILTVYDQYGDLEKLGIDVDLIEEIWLGSGYSWNAAKKKYTILP